MKDPAFMLGFQYGDPGVRMKGEEDLARLHVIDREYRHLEQMAAVLQWDQETYLPSGAAEGRAEQMALLKKLAHERFAGPETGRLLEALSSVPGNPQGDEGLSEIERDFLKVMRRHYDRAAKLPPEFVGAAARAEGLSQAAWVKARHDNDFFLFLPHLETMIDFARQKALYWGFGDRANHTVYDGLLDIYEPGMPASEVSGIFGPLRDRLTGLLRKIKLCPQCDASFLDLEYPVETQALFNHKLMGYLGFDRNRGRLDISAHPFTTTLGCDDIRITTRYFPHNLLSGIFSVIHESGHAFYEMGFPPELRGTCLSDGASMAFHESQSRFWENVIGRSWSFWKGLYPLLRDCFPEQLKKVDAETFWRVVNRIIPSPIRVDADEISYALHVILRFELEQRIFSGDLKPEQLPAVWREKTKEYLDLEYENDADGVLQDVHWSMGSFGYFPSYALGNLYGLQIFRKFRADLPDIEEMVTAGNFSVLRSWLNDKIYRWGCRLQPVELLMKITGEKLSMLPFVEYLEAKYTELYGL
jgi:carboxypeptidase Taq